MKRSLITTMLCKAKRYCRVLKKPYIRNRVNMDVDLYPNKEEETPVMNFKVNGDYKINLIDIVKLCAALVLVSSVISIFKK